MSKFIPIVFTVLYIPWSVFLFLIFNKGNWLTPIIIGCVVAIALIWGVDYLVVRSAVRFPSLILIVAGIVIAFLVPLGLGFLKS